TMVSMRGVAVWLNNRLNIQFHSDNFAHPENWNSGLNLITSTTDFAFSNGTGEMQVSPGGLTGLIYYFTNSSGTYGTNIILTGSPASQTLTNGTKTVTVATLADGHTRTVST